MKCRSLGMVSFQHDIITNGVGVSKKKQQESLRSPPPMPASHGNSVRARYQAKEASVRARVLYTFLHRKNRLHCSSKFKVHLELVSMTSANQYFRLIYDIHQLNILFRKSSAGLHTWPHILMSSCPINWDIKSPVTILSISCHLTC